MVTTPTVEDYRIPLNLLRIGQFIDDNGLADFNEIAKIQVRDAEQQTDYLETLRTYLTSNGNISTMALTPETTPTVPR